MTKPCPYCAKTIKPRRRTCGASECVGRDAAAWLQAKRAASQQLAADRRAAKQHERQKISKGRRQMILIRDRWNCHICGNPIDPGLSWPHPGSAVVDHIVPLSKGGSNDFRNLAAAHAKCNNSKASRAVESRRNMRLMNIQPRA